MVPAAEIKRRLAGVSRSLLPFLLAALLLSTGAVAAQELPAGEAPPTDQNQPASTAGRAGPDSLYPDPTLTPGAVFDGATREVICVPGYTRTVRNVTSAERAQVYAEYGVPDVPGADEVDHLISLELGGSNELSNLWPEPYTVPGAHEKDRVENYLHDQVCAGALDLADAQRMIADDWYAVFLSLPPTTVATAAPPRPVSTLAPTVSVNVTPPPSTQGVVFVAVTGGVPGGSVSVAIQTTPGASCTVQYTTPVGTLSTAQGQGRTASKTTDQDGKASWTWEIAPSTKPGTGSVTANCSSGTATTPITIR
jgi:hypothetical protein